jgi:hypothetical protein
MTKKTNESESLGLMVARMRSDQIKRDWNKLTPAEKTAKLKKDQEDTKKRMAEGKNHTWKSEGHYTKDGKEWSGPQHAHDGQVMTGEKHTADSQNLYHFKELSPEVKKKVLEKMKMSEGIVNAIMKSKTLNKNNYAIAAKELDKKMKKNPSKTKDAHAHDVSRYVKGVDARKLAAEEKDSRDGKYTKYQKQVQKRDKEKEQSAKKATKPGRTMPQLNIGMKHMTAAQKHAQPSHKKVKASVHGPAAYDPEAAKRRKAIERHQERKREKDYWDDDFTMTGCPLLEKLSPSDGIGTYIKDFKKSDAPQFKGASASKRRKMAVAAYLGAKRKKMSEAIDYSPQKHEWGTPEGTDQMKSLTPGQKNPKEAPIKALDTSTLVSLNVKDEYVKEETEAGETKKKYREDNADIAPEAGIVPLSKDDIANLYAEIETMTEDDMDEYGFFDDEDDEYDSTVDWDDFDFEDVDIVDTDYKVTTSEGVEHIFTLDEVLSVQGRLKRRFSARKNRQKLKVARNIALRRGSSPDRLKKRATRGARSMVYKRLLKGRDKSSMPPAEKARFERLIGMYQPLIQRFAQRMLPKMRKMEISRMKNRRGKAPQKSKKYKVARPVAKASSQKAKKYKIKR